MHVKAYITTFLFTLTTFGSFHTHGIFYAVILEIDNSTEAPIQLRGQLFQQWHQLSLIPLPKGTEPTNNTLTDTLAKHLPEVTFTEQLAKDNFPIYAAYSGIPNGVRSYISWLVNTSSPDSSDNNNQAPSEELLINKLFERFSPSPHIRIRVFSTTIPGQNLISIRPSKYGDAWNFRLSGIEHRTGEVSYTITPLLPEDIDTPLQDDIDTQFKAMNLPDVHHNKLHATRSSRAKIPLGRAQAVPGSSPLPVEPPRIRRKLPNEDQAFQHILLGEDYYLTTDALVVSAKQRPELLDWEPVKTLQGNASEFGAVQVYKAKTGGSPLVIKKIKEKNKCYRNLARETIILNKLRHENIITFEGMALHSISTGEKELWMALTYMPDGDMESMIGNSPHLLTNDNIRTIIKSLIDAVRYLHLNNIIHRDIKPGNILLMLKKGAVVQVKLSDFGFVASTNNPEATQSGCRSAEYAPPELLKHQPRPYLKKLDIWPIGVTVYASYVGTNIYPDSNAMTITDTVTWRLAHPHLEVASPKSLKRLQSALFPPPKR